MKEKILKLRSEGKTYNEISTILKCSLSTVSYHCGKGQKKKNIIRSIKNSVQRNKHVKNKRKEVKDYITRYKQFVGCKLCGIKDHRVLDFDHLDRKTKLYNVSCIMNWSYSIAFAKEEIRKCQILCANCHRIKTWKERNSPLAE